MATQSISYIYRLLDRMSPGFKTMQANAAKFSDQAGRKMDQLGKTSSRVGDIIKGILGAQIITRGLRSLSTQVQSFVTEASKIEDAVAGFTPLMGGAEKANELVAALNQTAATTPFQFENISAAAKQLLPVMNQDIGKTIETFRMLGDTAGGNAQKLDSITRGFMKSMLKGKVDMESLNMIAEAGVPIYSELANSMGVSVQEMMKMSSAGQIASSDLQEAFQNMTSEGGIFFNGMDIASQTLSGRLSTMRDNIALTKASIGAALTPTIKGLVDRVIDIAGRMRTWADANKEIIGTKITAFLSKMRDIFEIIEPRVKKIWVAISALSDAIRTMVKKAIEPLLPNGRQAISIFDMLTNTLVFLINTLTGFIEFFTPVIGFLAKITPYILGVVAAIKAWTIIQAVINILMTMNPIGLIIVAIGALITATIAIVKNWDTVKVALLNVWEILKAAMSKVGEFFIGIWEKVKAVGIAVWDGIKTAFTASVDFMKKIFFTFADYLLTIYASLFKGIMGAAAKVGEFMGKDVSGINNMIDKVSSLQANVREQSYIGDIQTARANQRAESTPIMQPGAVSVNANASVQVYKEQGVGVIPWQAGGNRGYNMQDSYKKAM